VPRSVEHFVSILFWFSMALTFTTPLFRIFNDHWRGESSLYWLLMSIMPTWLFDHCLKVGFIHHGIDYAREGETPAPDAAPVRGIDLAFGLHAGSALSWLVCAYIEIVHRNRTWLSHRKFGYVAAATFILHVFASLFNVYMDIVQHKPLPRIMLVVTSLSSVPYVINAIVIARQKPHDWMNSHKDMMINCFLLSIQGAGPIRLVTHMQLWVGCGPAQCQDRNGGLATHCMWEYVFRMLFVNLVTRYTKGMYCKMRGSKQLTLAFLVELRFFCVMSALLFALSHLHNNEFILAVLLGRERTARGTFTVFALGAFLSVDLRDVVSICRALPRALGRRLPAKVAMKSVSKDSNHLVMSTLPTLLTGGAQGTGTAKLQRVSSCCGHQQAVAASGKLPTFLTGGAQGTGTANLQRVSSCCGHQQVVAAGGTCTSSHRQSELRRSRTMHN